MDKDSTTAMGEPALFAGAAWFDPIEAGLRGRIRGFIEELVEQELAEALGRQRYERGGGLGHRHGRRERRLTGSFGRWRSPCHGPGCDPRTARRGSGAAPSCPATRG